MANKKLSELTEIVALPLDSLIHIVDPNDLSDSLQGSDFKFEINKLVETSTSIKAKRPLKTIEGQSLEGAGNITLDFVSLTGNESIEGFKTFTSPVKSPNAILPNEVVNKEQLDAIRPYKVYTATLLNDASNVPQPTIQENTFTNPIVWTRLNTGLYQGTLNSAFTLNKTNLFITPNAAGFYTITRNNVNSIFITTANSAGTTSDGFINNTTIEIRVYN